MDNTNTTPKNDLDNIDDCIITFEQARDRLEKIEAELGEKLNIKEDIRYNLINMEIKHELDDGDELVRDWLQAYNIYIDWIYDK